MSHKYDKHTQSLRNLTSQLEREFDDALNFIPRLIAPKVEQFELFVKHFSNEINFIESKRVVFNHQLNKLLQEEEQTVAQISALQNIITLQEQGLKGLQESCRYYLQSEEQISRNEAMVIESMNQLQSEGNLLQSKAKSHKILPREDSPKRTVQIDTAKGKITLRVQAQNTQNTKDYELLFVKAENKFVLKQATSDLTIKAVQQFNSHRSIGALHAQLSQIYKHENLN